MESGTSETIRLDFDSPGPEPDVQAVSNGQSLEATCAAMTAVYYWAHLCKVANGNGKKMSADGYVVEVSHVER